MATFFSTYQQKRIDARNGNSGAIANAHEAFSGIVPTAFTVKVPAGLAVNDVIELAPAERGLAVIPELSFIRPSNAASTFSVKLQLKPATGAAVDLSAARTVNNAAVPLAPAASGALAVSGEGAIWQLLVTAVTTAVATTELAVDLLLRRSQGNH